MREKPVSRRYILIRLKEGERRHGSGMLASCYGSAARAGTRLALSAAWALHKKSGLHTIYGVQILNKPPYLIVDRNFCTKPAACIPLSPRLPSGTVYGSLASQVY